MNPGSSLRIILSAMIVIMCAPYGHTGTIKFDAVGKYPGNLVFDDAPGDVLEIASPHDRYHPALVYSGRLAEWGREWAGCGAISGMGAWLDPKQHRAIAPESAHFKTAGHGRAHTEVACGHEQDIGSDPEPVWTHSGSPATPEPLSLGSLTEVTTPEPSNLLLFATALTSLLVLWRKITG